MLLLIAAELYVLYYPNTFNRKANYLDAEGAKVQTAVFGSSHNQNAINPEYLSMPAINLANAGQDLQLDSALFFHSLSKLPSLHTVILEMDYHSLEEKNDPDYFRIPWYNRFFGFELYPTSMFSKLSVYASSPAFFNQLFVDHINPKKITYKLNKYGFIVNDFPGVMEDLDYDSAALMRTAAKRLRGKHTKESLENYHFNIAKLNAIINFCKTRGIWVMLISTPMYETYIKNEVPAKKARRRAYIDSVKTTPGLSYVDFENSNRFDVHDFKNDDHLNSNGAKKFTRMIDSLLKTLPAAKN